MIFFQSYMVIVAVFVPLLQRHGLNMVQVMQTQALFAAIVAVCEVPSGYLADLWGRRNTIIAGLALIACAYTWLTGADSFSDFLVYEILMGLGLSLSSGADLALLYDTQTALNEQSGGLNVPHGRHISRLVAIESYGGAASGLTVGLLTLAGWDWVLWAQCCCGLFSLWFALHLIEPPRKLAVGGHRHNLHRIVHTVSGRPPVVWTGLAIIVFSLVGLYAFWIYQKYWEFNGIPITWFGYLWAVHCLLRGCVAHFGHEIERALGWRKVFIISALMPLTAFLGMGLFGGWVGLGFSLGLIISRGLSTVVFYNALNQRVESEFRATLNSLVSLGTRGLFILSGPYLGYLMDRLGVNSTLLILAAVFTPVIIAVLYRLSLAIQGESGSIPAGPGLSGVKKGAESG